MPAPRWVELATALAVHDEQLAEHGGLVGVRDRTLLESALARPRNLHEYERAPLSALAASYAIGIARNHPFVDGNKRTSLVVAELFLALNGFELRATDAEVASVWLTVAAGTVSDAELASWIEANLEPA